MSSLAGLVAALIVAAAPSHHAPPPVVFATMHFRSANFLVLRVKDRPTRSCTVKGQQSQTQAGRIERAMGPVACEQPPRSKVILTFSGGLFGNGR